MLVHRNDTAVAEDGKLFSQIDLGHADLVQKVRFAGPIQQLRQTTQHRLILSSIRSQLRNGLRDQDIEPIQAFRLVSLHIVVRLLQDFLDCQSSFGARLEHG